MSKESVRAHLIKCMGDELSTPIGSDGVEILKWADSEDKDWCILSTVGMSEIQQHVPEGASCVSKDPRIELLMFSAEADADDLAKILLTLVGYPESQQTFLHWLHDLDLGRPIVPNSKLTSVMFTFPLALDSDQATFQADGKRVDIVQVVPLTAGERAFIKENDSDALEDIFGEQEIDVTDLMRDSVV